MGNKLLGLASAVLVVVLLVMIYNNTPGLSSALIPGTPSTTISQTQGGGGSSGIKSSMSSVTVLTHPVIAGNTSGSGTYANGVQINISQTPNHGYVFSNWSCAGEGCYYGTNSSQVLTVTGNIVEVANYNVTIAVSTYQARGGTVTGGGSFAYNSSDTVVSAMPDPGYYFNKWICIGIGCYSGTNSTITLTTEYPVTEVAEFTQSAPPFNYTAGGVYAITHGFNYARLVLNGNYTDYVCGGASGGPNLSPGLRGVSWQQLTSANGYTSTGVSSNNTCTMYAYPNATDAAIVGIGVDANSYSLYNYSQAPRVSFNLDQNNSLLAVMVDGLYHLTLAASHENSTAFSCGPGFPDACGRGLSFPSPTIDYPQQSNCTVEQVAANTNGNVHSSFAELFVCNPAVSGVYSINQSVLYNGSVSTYVFNK